MTYEWNPLWRDVESPENAAYIASLRRMIIASINWLAGHPDADPRWREPNKRSIAREAGVSDDVPVEQMVFTGDWERWFVPLNAEAIAWFEAIERACEAIGGKENAPSSYMFGKAVACGILFKREGWERFDRFMLESHDQAGH